MFLKIERLLNSLEYHVHKNIDETLYRNKTFLSSKWSFLEYNILRWSKRHSYYIQLMFILATLLTASLLLWKSQIAPIAIIYLPNWQKLIEWQDGFLAGQLTIVGVVYPLVIGLIGVLFQNKSAKKILFPIYQMYSGFMFAGLSGLSLSIFIIVGYFLKAGVNTSTYLAICITTALWLTFNLLLTCWFFVSTFLMLDETKRDRLVIRFTIHELCEVDIRNRMRALLLINSIKNSLLANPDENILKISTYDYNDDKYSEITSSSKDQVHVSNVYFSIINTIIQYYYYKIKISHFIKNHHIGKWLTNNVGISWPDIDLNVERKFVLQPIFTTKNERKLVFFRYTGLKIGWLSKALIKFSVKTKKHDESLDKSLTSMMLGFVGTTNDSIREKNFSEFKDSLSNIVKWHIEIASALSFFNDDNKDDNWILLPTANFFSRSYLDEIMIQYYEVAKSAVELIPDNIDFFDEIIYLHKRIFWGREKLVDREGHSLIQGSYYTWSLLMEWRSYSSSSSDIRIANKYEDVLFHFVGAWESWLDYLEPKNQNLDDLKDSLPLLLSHLEFTAHTIISALRYNNIEATGWGVDMLNNWHDKISVRSYDQNYLEYTWLSELVTHNFLFKDPDEEPWITILNNREFNLQSAFYIALKNAAFDLRIITACYILLKPNLNDDIKLRGFVKALLSGDPIHPTGSIRNRERSISRASDILMAYIRHRDYQNYDVDSYGSWLSKNLSLFSRVNEQRRVSGRIYSGWGRSDVNSMNSAYVEIAVSLSNNQWQLSHKFFEVVFSNIFRHQDKDSLVRDLNEWIRISDTIDKTFLISKEEFNKNLDNFKVSIQNVISQINQRKNKIVAEAEIDEEVLIKFGLVCSEVIINKDYTTEFPMNLFESVKFNGSRLNNNLFKLNINGYLKENIAKNIDANRAINEEDWLKTLTGNDIKTNILRKILQCKISNSISYDSADDNIRYILKQSKSINNPILLSGCAELNNLIFEARHNKEISDEFSISFIDGYGMDYLCHIGNIIVYSIHFSDLNCSFLTSHNSFKCIEFGKVDESQFVEIDYESSDAENVGVLSINYWMDIVFSDDLEIIQTEIKSI